MPEVTYVGIFDEVEVDGVGACKKGASVEVPAALAKSLLEQVENWEKTKVSKP